MAYTILGALAGQTQSSAAATDGTSIVGTATDGAGQHAVVWAVAAPTAAPTILGTNATYNTFPFTNAVDGPYIVGGAFDVSFNLQAFIWDTGNPTAAPILFGDALSNAYGVSGTRVVGYASNNAVMWDATNPTAPGTALGTIAGQVASYPNWIDGDRIVGYAQDSTTSYAVLWDATNPTAAPTILAELTGNTYGADYAAFCYGVHGDVIVGSYESTANSFNDFPLMWDATNPTAAPVALGAVTPEFDAIAFAASGTTMAGYVDSTANFASAWDIADPTAAPALYDLVPGQSSSRAFGISGDSTVGNVTASGVTSGILWSPPPPPPPIVSITIAGTEHYLDAPFRVGATGQSLIRIENTAPGIARATIKLYDPTNSIVVADNDEVVIVDQTVSGNAFLGNVQSWNYEIIATYRWINITAVDLNSWLDTILVGVPDGTQWVEDPPGTFTPYDPNATTLASDSATVQALFNNYAAFLNLDVTTYVETLAPSLASVPIKWNEVTLRSALDDVASLVSPNLRYWIDQNRAVHWTITALVPSNVSGTAPGPILRMFPVTVGGGGGSPIVLTDGTADGVTSFNYEALQIGWDDSGWADLVYVSGATTYTRSRTYTVEYLGGGLYQGWTGTDYVYGDVYPTPSNLTIRVLPNDSSTALGTLTVGTVVVTIGYLTGQGTYTFSGTQSDWYRILYKGANAYIHAHGTAPYNNAGLVTGTVFTCEGTLQSRSIPETSTPLWKQEWATANVEFPVGARYDPTQPDYLWVVDGFYAKVYQLRLSDRTVVGSPAYLGNAVPKPLGLSSDPNDPTIYWVLNAPWRYGGSATGAFIGKMRAADNTLLATYALPSQRWTDLKVSGSFIWLTNFDTDKIHKYSKTTFTEDQAYSISYSGAAQVNPTGLYIDTDGATTTLGYFFLGQERFLLADETAPTTITGTQSTKGTLIEGGEMNVTSHIELFSVSDSAHRTWAFALQAVTPASSVSYYVITQPGGTFDRYWLPTDPARSQLLATNYDDETGGSGWVDPFAAPWGVTIGGSPSTTTLAAPRQRLMTANNSDSRAVRNNLGGSALLSAGQSVARGAATLYVNVGGWLPGQGLELTSVPASLSSATYMTQKATTTFLSGRGDRVVALEFGNAPVGSIGLRRVAQAPVGSKPRRPTLRMLLTATNNTPGPNGTVRIFAQSIDQAGNPWPIANKTVTWSMHVYDTSGNEVTPVVSYSFSPNPSTTDVYGQAWTDLTVDAQTGWSYFPSATLDTEA